MAAFGRRGHRAHTCPGVKRSVKYDTSRHRNARSNGLSTFSWAVVQTRAPPRPMTGNRPFHGDDIQGRLVLHLAREPVDTVRVSVERLFVVVTVRATALHGAVAEPAAGERGIVARGCSLRMSKERWPAGRSPRRVRARPPRFGRYEKLRTQPAAWPTGDWRAKGPCANECFDVMYEARAMRRNPHVMSATMTQ